MLVSLGVDLSTIRQQVMELIGEHAAPQTTDKVLSHEGIPRRPANVVPGYERFTDQARWVLVLAEDEARFLNHSFIGTEHLLLGLIQEGDGRAAKVLTSLGIAVEAVRRQGRGNNRSGRVGTGWFSSADTTLEEAPRTLRSRSAPAWAPLRRHRTSAAGPGARRRRCRGAGARDVRCRPVNCSSAGSPNDGSHGAQTTAPRPDLIRTRNCQVFRSSK